MVAFFYTSDPNSKPSRCRSWVGARADRALSALEDVARRPLAFGTPPKTRLVVPAQRPAAATGNPRGRR